MASGRAAPLVSCGKLRRVFTRAHPHPMPEITSGPLAAIDIGSNSFRLEVGQLAGSQYRRLEYKKETVRLGAGLDADGMLGEAAAERGLECLRRFSVALAALPPQRVRAVATQTLREARNRDAFLARAEAALGHPIEVIAGREEARLIYAGVALLQPPAAPRLVIDIGGRSTELILGHGELPSAAESFPVGSVGLSMRFFPQGVLDEASFQAAQVAAGAEFEEAMATFAPALWQEALGSSGTAGAVAQLLQAEGRGDGRITPEHLRWCIERCLAAGHVDRLDFKGLKADRRPVIPGGLAILYTLAVQFGIGELQPAKGALRQGVIVDLARRLDSADGPAETDRGALRDIRHATVASLQHRFQADPEQAERVTAAALSFFDAVPDGADEGESRRELAWACGLHECGLMVSHHDHHRHCAYLVGHADAPGFSQNQQRRIADLVLGQRGGLRKLESALAQPGFAWQVMCLRLAAIVCHARQTVDPAPLRLARQGSQVRLQPTAGWAEQHPRTMYLLAEEAEVWAKSAALRLTLTP